MADKYVPMFELGSGAFGTAWVVKTKDKGAKLVSKVIKIAGLSNKDIDNCVTEVVVLGNCHHANIVRYIEAFVDSGALHIIMEYAADGDLHQKIERQAGKYFPNQVILGWFVQVLLALEYIHGKNILHRDLKPRNVFLTSDGTVKLGDFGIARVLNNTLDLAHTQIGTPLYISPEICDNKPYNSRSDMWAAGCLLYELCVHRVPFLAASVSELSERIRRGCYDSLPRQFGSTIPFVISHLVRVSPDDRLSASEILKIQEVRTYIRIGGKMDSYSSKCQRSRSVHRPPAVNRALAQQRSYSENRGKVDQCSKMDSNSAKDEACATKKGGNSNEKCSKESESHKNVKRKNDKGKHVCRLSSVNKECDENGTIQESTSVSSKESNDQRSKEYNKVSDEIGRDIVSEKEFQVSVKKYPGMCNDSPGMCNDAGLKGINAAAFEQAVLIDKSGNRDEQLEVSEIPKPGSGRSNGVERGSRNPTTDDNCMGDMDNGSNVDKQKQGKYWLRPHGKVETGFNKPAADVDGEDSIDDDDAVVKEDKVMGHDRDMMADTVSRWPEGHVIKSRTYTVNASVLRRLSDVSPKLSSTVRKQRFALSVSDPSGLCAQVPSPYSASQCDEAEIEDVFSSPTHQPQGGSGHGASPTHEPCGASGATKPVKSPLCSKTYTVKDANNNTGHSGEVMSIDDLNSVLILALSTHQYDKHRASQILQQGLLRRLGKTRATQLIHQVTQLVVEEGQSYLAVKNIFKGDELELLPLVVMCCYSY